MDLLVVSDTHGHGERLLDVVRRRQVGAILFLGDGLRDLACLPGESPPVRAVRGNCDFSGGDVPLFRVEQFGNVRVFMTHGHTFWVKRSLDAAVAAAVRQDADVLLYGHTHIPFTTQIPKGAVYGGETVQKPLTVLCPGSLGEPRGGVPTFGTLTLRPNGILAAIGGW